MHERAAMNAGNVFVIAMLALLVAVLLIAVWAAHG
jgi:hypothetical protein